MAAVELGAGRLLALAEFPSLLGSLGRMVLLVPLVLLVGVVGVVGVGWWEELSWSGAGFEGPAVEGFLLVVVMAEPVEVVEVGFALLRPGGAVVPLGVLVSVAALD